MHYCYVLEGQTTSEPFHTSPFPQHATIFGDKTGRLLSIGLVQKRLNYQTLRTLSFSQFGVETKLFF
jgi:hypothetical protein